MDHTPSPPIQVEEGNHPKGEGRWDRIDVHLLRQYQTWGKVLKLDTVQNEDKTTTYVPIVVILPATLGPFFVKRKNVVGVARNCERMVRAKVHRVETVCPHHS